jgi:hypothetical protein
LKIDKRNHYFLSFLKELNKLILESNDIEFSLKAGFVYGFLLKTNFVGIYREDSLESELVRKAMDVVPTSESPVQDRILHVISEPYEVGGHTRLLEQLHNLIPSASDVLVALPYADDAKSLYLHEDSTVYHSPSGFDLKDLVRIASTYKTICLYIHPHDLLTAVAIGIVKRRISCHVVFINHADHCFSFGFYSADIIAEISSFGFALSQKNRALQSSFLGIPLNQCEFPQTTDDHEGMTHIFSAASRDKYKPCNGLSFPLMAKALLHATPNCKVTVVGPTFLDFWWLPVKLRFPFRFNLHSSLPYDRYIELLQKADIYLDSLPMVGGTAFPEIRNKGINVTGLATSAMGYSPLDETKFNSIEELAKDIRCFATGASNRIIEINNSERLLSEALKIHGPEQISLRFTEILKTGKQFVPNISSREHDLCFYEKQWLSQGRLNIDVGVLWIVYGQFKKGQRDLFFALLRAIGISGFLRLVMRYFRLKLRNSLFAV